jgi:hypothetical protein
VTSRFVQKDAVVVEVFVWSSLAVSFSDFADLARLLDFYQTKVRIANDFCTHAEQWCELEPTNSPKANYDVFKFGKAYRQFCVRSVHDKPLPRILSGIERWQFEDDFHEFSRGA